MADTKILREYLISLGFKTDAPSMGKFERSIDKAQFGVAGLAKTVLGVAAGVQAMVAIFANQMTQMYYASRKAESSVENLQAVRFASEQVGISAEATTAAVQGMAKALREQPGMRGFLEGFIGDSSKMDNTERYIALVEKLKTLPFFQAQQIGSMFGINPDDLFLLQEGIEKFKTAYALRKQMNKDGALDASEAAKAAVAYSQAINEMTTRLGVLKDMFAVWVLPGFQKFTDAVNSNLDSLTKWLGKFTSVGDAAKSLVGKPGEQRSKPKNFFEWLVTPLPLGSDPGARVGTEKGRRSSSAPSAGSGAPGAMFADLEAKYGLPAGLLDSIWAKESSRGRNMLSPAGAQGHFQFMPKTAKQYGVDDPSNLEQSATGAAKYLSSLLKRYGGDLAAAVGAYNWGEGNMDLYRMGKKDMPNETRDYTTKLAGKIPAVKVDINVHGVQDPKRVAEIVADRQSQVTADTIRNFTSNIR